MKKPKRLVDFQVFVKATDLKTDQQKRAVQAALPASEIIRLWLRERELPAPFRKLLVTLGPRETSSTWHGQVTVALDVCEVTEAVDFEGLGTGRDCTWVFQVVKHALQRTHEETGWESQEFEEKIDALASSRPPWIHVLRALTRLDAPSGTSYEIHYVVTPGHTEVVVHVARRDGSGRQVTVASRDGLLYLEDDFPIARTRLSSDFLLLLDSAGKELARIPIGTGLTGRMRT